MIPQLLSTEPVSVPPPPFFRPVEPPIRNVRCSFPRYERAYGDTAAKEGGLRFEERVQRRLLNSYQGYHASPKVFFWDRGGCRSCIPDGLLLLRDRSLIVEIKAQHSPEAWWQLERLYKPLIEVFAPGIPVARLEICKSFDPAMPFPGDFELVSSIDEFLNRSDTKNSFGVHPWRMK